jgi:uncharacterized protein YdiU (UPF0061 family)
MKFSNTYAELGGNFYQRTQPATVASPKLLLWNKPLAKALNVDASLQHDSALAAQCFSGNQLLAGADAMALAYSGHQFGQLNPQLGDGRAHLLGEVIDQDNHRVDIQLKGSGPTPFSRQGDGRCALGPALREFIMSEAMYALGVPTSRCLAVVATGETVYRQTPKPGAVVTRVAASHIRVGTFQYFAIRKDLDALQKLLDYSIERHFPAIDISSPTKALQFLAACIGKQITLVVEWMRVGFIHGVMNTDNVAISGETIDFGPCAMMGTYHPDTVYSSIDRRGRYAFANQASITLWNMTRLAECLLPLINDDEEKAVAAVEPLLNKFSPDFHYAYFQMLANKLGLSDIKVSERHFIEALLTMMQEQQLDYTQTFADLTNSLNNETVATNLANTLGDWYQQWRWRLDTSTDDFEQIKARMKRNNPIVIPRNHHVEAALKVCEENGDLNAVEALLTVIRSPYDELATTVNYQDSPADGDKSYQTFCGT